MQVITQSGVNSVVSTTPAILSALYDSSIELLRSTMTPHTHIPVLLKEVLSYLKPHQGGQYLDCTFGRGGYARAILEAADCTLTAVDRDPHAGEVAQQFKAEFDDRFTFVQECFGNIHALFAEQAGQFDGIVFDLGVSSPQLDEASRGFSFRYDAPLDMRMSESGQTAADVINKLPEKQLADIIYLYGEEHYSRPIAKAICEQRKEQPFSTTHELANLVRRIVPRSRDGIDPATRTFQALRIYVNNELEEIERGLQGALDLLAPGGILVVVSFHSLEDRIVKQFINLNSQPQGTSRHLPLRKHDLPILTKLTRKPVEPSSDETRANPRARSAKLRAAQKQERTTA
jgi:16S rRNA (cytosine1402-N4)-methyltransferase